MAETSVESNSEDLADDFGEFESVEPSLPIDKPTPTAALDALLDLGVQNSPEKQQSEVENGDGNDMLNFDTSMMQPSEAEPALAGVGPDESTPPLVSEDPFGDFITPPLTETDIFAATAAITATTGETIDIVSEGYASGFNSVLPTPAVSDDGTEPPTEEDVDFDNFGQEHEISAIIDIAEPKESVIEKDYDFAGFGGDQNGLPLASTEAPPPPAMENFFGEFNNAVPETTESVLLTVDEVSSAVPRPEDGEQTPEDENDEFGEFDGFHDAPVTYQEPPSSLSIPQDKLTASPKADDLPTVKSTEAPTPTADVDEDDFGDFGDFNDAPIIAPQNEAVHQTPDVPAATVTDGDDDDFGDFGDFTEGPQTATSEVTSSVPPTTTLEEHNNNDDVDDDDFGDFGDFNDASQDTAPVPSRPAVENEDDFGNFDSISATTGATVSQPPQTTLHDPFLDQAKHVFAQVFGNDALDATDDAQIDGSTDAPKMLKDVLTELMSEGKELEDVTPQWANQQILSILGSIKMIETAEPTVILDKHALYPYSHYSYPVEATRVDITVTESNSSKRRTLSIDFPEEGEKEDAPSTDTETVSKSTDVTPGDGVASATIVSIPEAPVDVKLDFTDFKAPSVNDGSGAVADDKEVSSAGRLFLQQIPDFSFMLSSELILPKK